MDLVLSFDFINRIELCAKDYLLRKQKKKTRRGVISPG